MKRWLTFDGRSDMKRSLLLLPVLAISFAGCFREMSETVHDESAGLNGSFEIVRSGLPVNWGVYSPTTIPAGDYELSLDRQNFVHGKQSLKFTIRDCSDTGGWLSPGIFRETLAKPDVTYKISFWIKTEGSAIRAEAGGVSAFEGKYVTLLESYDSIPEWTKIEYEYRMPESFDVLRIQINGLSPGNLWLDDVRIETVTG